jgi:hypothetical protein
MRAPFPSQNQTATGASFVDCEKIATQVDLGRVRYRAKARLEKTVIPGERSAGPTFVTALVQVPRPRRNVGARMRRVAKFEDLTVENPAEARLWRKRSAIIMLSIVAVWALVLYDVFFVEAIVDGEVHLRLSMILLPVAIYLLVYAFRARRPRASLASRLGAALLLSICIVSTIMPIYSVGLDKGLIVAVYYATAIAVSLLSTFLVLAFLAELS